MTTSQTWIVCEHSGRWAATLRVAFARLPGAQTTPRLREVRTLDELSTHLDERLAEHRSDMALIEVGPANLTGVLNLLVDRGSRLAQFVALLDGALDPKQPPSAKPRESGTRRVVDLLWEAGVAEVVESPRQLRGLLALHDRLAVARGPIIGGFAERQSFADWAWSALPWQDS